MQVKLTRNADGDTTNVVVVDDTGVETQRWTLEEAHEWLSSNLSAEIDMRACANGSCLWCLVNEALEGVR